LPFILKEFKLLWALGEARTRLRQSPPESPSECNFYELQARIMAELLNADPPAVQERTERLIYRGWEPIFKKVKLYPHVKETLAALKDGGLKLGLLSDFPPEIKLAHLGLETYWSQESCRFQGTDRFQSPAGAVGEGGLWDTVLCSELCCRLKPDKVPFEELARLMGLSPERILYVGNSVAYDIVGARQAGMRAALVCSLGKLRRKTGGADFVFSDYRQLREFVLN
jgi:putative hydrolase of the HAD superfamily